VGQRAQAIEQGAARPIAWRCNPTAANNTLTPIQGVDASYACPKRIKQAFLLDILWLFFR